MSTERTVKPPRIVTAATARGVWVGWPGGSRFFAAESAGTGASGTGGTEVRAPMTGRVVEVAVAPGEQVAVDQLLVILHAMKMEYRLTAPSAGVVERIACAPGDMVDLEAVLVALAPPPAAAKSGEPAP